MCHHQELHRVFVRRIQPGCGQDHHVERRGCADGSGECDDGSRPKILYVATTRRRRPTAPDADDIRRTTAAPEPVIDVIISTTSLTRNWFMGGRREGYGVAGGRRR